jgi:hypothetical protein
LNLAVSPSAFSVQPTTTISAGREGHKVDFNSQNKTGGLPAACCFYEAFVQFNAGLQFYAELACQL